MPAYYAESCLQFKSKSVTEIEQTLHRSYERDRFKELFVPQMTAWRQEVAYLQSAISSEQLSNSDLSHWGVALEFVIPRKMGRIDAVLLIGDAIVVLEFKTKTVDSGSADQVEDYCLD